MAQTVTATPAPAPWQPWRSPEEVASLARRARRRAAAGRAGRQPHIWQVVWNSLVLAVGTTVIVVVVATLAGYFVSRHDFRRRTAFLTGALMLQAFPGITLLVPLFILLRTLNLLNSMAGVILVIAALHLPFALFVMKGFFDGIPWDIEMSAPIA